MTATLSTPAPLPRAAALHSDVKMFLTRRMTFFMEKNLHTYVRARNIVECLVGMVELRGLPWRFCRKTRRTRRRPRARRGPASGPRPSRRCSARPAAGPSAGIACPGATPSCPRRGPAWTGSPLRGRKGRHFCRRSLWNTNGYVRFIPWFHKLRASLVQVGSD